MSADPVLNAMPRFEDEPPEETPEERTARFEAEALQHLDALRRIQIAGRQGLHHRGEAADRAGASISIASRSIPAAQPTAGNGGVDSDTLSNGGFSWRLTARYKPGTDTSLYATYARGRRPEVLVASVRHPMHVVEAAKIGADVMTAPPAVIQALASHPLTDKGLAQFVEDSKKLS